MTEMEERARRRRLLTWRYRLFFAIGLVLLMWNWLTVLPALWWSNIPSNAAASLTTWYMLVQGIALRWLWRWLGPYVKRQDDRS